MKKSLFPNLLIAASFSLLAEQVHAQAECELELPPVPEIFNSQQVYTDQVNLVDASYDDYVNSLNTQINCLEKAQSALNQEDENFAEIFYLYEDIKTIVNRSRSSLDERYNFLMANKIDAKERKEAQD